MLYLAAGVGPCLVPHFETNPPPRSVRLPGLFILSSSESPLSPGPLLPLTTTQYRPTGTPPACPLADLIVLGRWRSGGSFPESGSPKPALSRLVLPHPPPFPTLHAAVASMRSRPLVIQPVHSFPGRTIALFPIEPYPYRYLTLDRFRFSCLPSSTVPSHQVFWWRESASCPEAPLPSPSSSPQLSVLFLPTAVSLPSGCASPRSVVAPHHLRESSLSLLHPLPPLITSPHSFLPLPPYLFSLCLSATPSPTLIPPPLLQHPSAPFAYTLVALVSFNFTLPLTSYHFLSFLTSLSPSPCSLFAPSLPHCSCRSNPPFSSVLTVFFSLPLYDLSLFHSLQPPLSLSLTAAFSIMPFFLSTHLLPSVLSHI